jgi:hypothetical protein
MSSLDQINYSQEHIAGNQCTIADPELDLNYTFSADNSVNGTSDTSETPLRGKLLSTAGTKNTLSDSGEQQLALPK